jgi:hypothetical protein
VETKTNGPESRMRSDFLALEKVCVGLGKEDGKKVAGFD